MTAYATEESPPPDLRSRRARLLRGLIGGVHGAVMVGGAAAVLAERFGGRRGLLRAWTREGGPVETAGALVLLAIAATAAFQALRPARRPWPGRIGAAAVLAMAGAALLAAMEEISWGQHLLGFPSPPFFLRHNRQGETNLHNLIPAELFGLATNVAVYAAFVFGPLLLRLARPRSGPAAELRRLAPSIHNVLIFCAAFAYQAYFLRETAADTVAFWLALGVAALLIRREGADRPTGAWLHLGLVAACGVLFMVCHRVFGYNNLQYEIREFIIAYGILFWMVGWPRRRTTA